MRNLFCLLVTALISFSAFAQIKGTIQDSRTKEPIPYVNIWVENQSSGTSADENGNFSLPETDASKSIVFTAVGYGTKTLKITEVSGTIYLTPQAIELDEVVIESRKNTEKITIGSLKDAEKNHYYGINGANPWMHANFYEYKPEYANAPYIKTIKLITSTEHKGSSFNVRLYDVDENGYPGDYLYDENIICYPKNGKSTYTIDISKLNIRFPEKGVFIALEWLIIEQNRYELVEKIKFDANGNKIELKPEDYIKRDVYTPSFAIAYADDKIIPWVYINGKWGKYSKTEWCLNMELTLTN
jgi:hypothetical protein